MLGLTATDSRNVLRDGLALFWVFYRSDLMKAGKINQFDGAALVKHNETASCGRNQRCVGRNNGNPGGSPGTLTGDTDDRRHLPPRFAPHVQVPVGQRGRVVQTREAGHRHDQFILHFVPDSASKGRQNNCVRPEGTAHFRFRRESKQPLLVLATAHDSYTDDVMLSFSLEVLVHYFSISTL